MRIVHFAAGAGDMYCGACARDVTLARALITLGHEVQVVPLYTPLRLEDDKPLATTPVFMGALNAYLQQLSPLSGRAPGFLTHLLDHPAVLRWVSRFAVRTKPSELGPMTVSMLQGSDGRQRREMGKLFAYLRSQPAPEVASVTNSLLSALAPELKRHFRAPVVCGLQGEDDFVGAMPEPYRSQAQELMRRNAEHVDLFIAPGEAYAGQMADFLAVPPEKVRVVRTGIEAGDMRHDEPRVREPFVLGYLSVITPRKGLHLLVDAFRQLALEQGRELIVRMAGRVLDRAYWKQIAREVAAAGLSGRFEYLGEVDSAGKAEFLRACSAFCQPSPLPETRGIAAMEAMAVGVPVIVPDSGIFPEMLAVGGGGLTFPPGDAAGLAAAAAELMDEPEAADSMGRKAAQAVAAHFSAQRAAEETLVLFRELDGRRRVRSPLMGRTPQ